MKKLAILIKLWAKGRGINDAFMGTLSSYSYILMLIHYLQLKGKGRPNILPNLQRPDKEFYEKNGLEYPVTKKLEEGSPAEVFYFDWIEQEIPRERMA